MPTWLLALLEWVVGQILARLDTGEAKQALAKVLLTVDGMVQAAVATQVGPLANIEKEAAVAFDSAVQGIVKALQA